MIAIIQLNLSRKRWVFTQLVLNIRICISPAVLLVKINLCFFMFIRSYFSEFTVGPIQGGGAHKVRASGNGLARGEVNSLSKLWLL
jgi:hypothetical protein